MAVSISRRKWRSGLQLARTGLLIVVVILAAQLFAARTECLSSRSVEKRWKRAGLETIGRSLRDSTGDTLESARAVSESAASLLAGAAVPKLSPQLLQRRINHPLPPPPPANVHTIFTAECGEYFRWQALGLVHSLEKSGQPGKVTRLLSCTDAQWAVEPLKTEIVDTFRAPSFATNPHNGDIYGGYNKPSAVMSWLEHVEPEEAYILILDTDLIIRSPFLPAALGVHRGYARSSEFGYMKGCCNELALRHIPEVLPRNDTLGGPYGRRSDMVSGFTLMEKSDVKHLAPLWLKFSEDVRFDDMAWTLSGDSYTPNPGDKPWISEMYGFSYGCAKADIWHEFINGSMIYPGELVPVPPMVLHLGLKIEVQGTDYQFDKHWAKDFDPSLCPPWNLVPVFNETHGGSGGLFPHPPSPASLTSQGTELLRDLLTLEVPLTLNEAFCEHHRRACPASAELERECSKVERDGIDMARLFKELEMPGALCVDKDQRCALWASGGECRKNSGYMTKHCRKTCQMCPSSGSLDTRSV